MRPAGEVRKALLQACEDLAHDCPQGRGPIMREIAQRACVGLSAARDAMRNMRRAGAITQVHERRVPYRNRPVAEWVPASMLGAANDPVMGLSQALKAWG